MSDDMTPWWCSLRSSRGIYIVAQSATPWQKCIILSDGFLSKFKVCACRVSFRGQAGGGIYPPTWQWKFLQFLLLMIPNDITCTCTCIHVIPVIIPACPLLDISAPPPPPQTITLLIVPLNGFLNETLA